MWTVTCVGVWGVAFWLWASLLQLCPSSLFTQAAVLSEQ